MTPEELEDLAGRLQALACAEAVPVPFGPGRWILSIPEGVSPGDLVIISLTPRGEDRPGPDGS